MTPDIVRIVAEWLRHETYGVAHYLASVPIETGATRLASLTILDEMSDPVTALKQVPDVTPALQVMTTASPISSTSPVSNPSPPDRRVEIGVRFASKHKNAAVVLEQAGQVMRATERSLRALIQTPAGNVARTRNQVQLYHIEDWRTEYGIENDDTLITVALVLTARCRDGWVAAGL